MADDIINPKALEPLYAPWEVPNKHRVKGGEVRDIRRPSSVTVANTLRAFVREWRDGLGDGNWQYAGASDTTLELLEHWFLRDHMAKARDGSTYPFRYHFCQREAIETFIYLLEVRDVRRLTSLVS